MRPLLTALIGFYIRFVSPFTAPRCRYLPTCSHYALEAVRRYGAFRGGIMTLARLGRCHPFGRSGYDPVPDKLTEHHHG